MNLSKTANFVLLFLGSITILVIGKSLLIPMVMALLIWFLIKEIRNYASKVPFIGNKIPKWILSIIASIILFIFLGFIMSLIISNIQNISQNLSVYEANLHILNSRFRSNYNIDLMKELSAYIGNYDFTSILTKLFDTLTDLFSDFIMVILYVLFFFFEESVFTPKLKAMYPSNSKFVDVQANLQKISKSISSYITLKTLVSVITGLASYIVLVIMGVDSALFWSFLIFTFNFIPAIGSLIGTIFPALIALLQFGELGPALWVLLLVGAIQVIVGNILEPKVMGNSLNVSSLVVILSLSFWGAIWGIAGMVLSVPITVIMVILFSQFKDTKNIAILLSEKGKV